MEGTKAQSMDQDSYWLLGANVIQDNDSVLEITPSYHWKIAFKLKRNVTSSKDAMVTSSQSLRGY